jgi:hypothetical protein
LISQQNKSIFLAPKKTRTKFISKAYLLISLKHYYTSLYKMAGDAGELQAISLFLAARKFQSNELIAKKIAPQQENTAHATL